MASSFLSKADNAEWPDTVQGTRQMYDDWAKTYDSDLMQHGYNAPTSIAKTLVKWVPDKKARVMDMACGTGLIGEKLLKAGYSSIDGLDMSAESIKICKEKNIYGRIVCSEVTTNRLDIDNDTCDATVCVGCFSPNHMNGECFPELARITKPGGFLVIAMKQAYFETNYGGKIEAAIQSMVQLSKWEVVARDHLEGYFGEHNGVTFVFKIM
ncbi:methyltransferase-like protein 27 isoform X1 [Amphiura filiformis]|uniref:methyltransferase-like protein 27 isoform X1 n=1 Tax=Amphiura filiformis TaxID=82378 RepID=UPI003B2275D9